jgi:hypothetical protein
VKEGRVVEKREIRKEKGEDGRGKEEVESKMMYIKGTERGGTDCRLVGYKADQ